MALSVIGSVTGYIPGTASINLTVPAGVTTSHLGIIQTTTSVPGTDDISVSGWTQRVENPTGQANHEVSIFTRLGGHTAGDTITVSQSLNHNVRVSAVWIDTQSRDIAVVGATGTRNGVSSANNVIPGITLTDLTQEVLVFSTERTTADGTAISSQSPASPTQLFFSEFTDIDTTHYLGWFTPTNTTVPTQTVTYSGAAGNGFGVMMGLAQAVVGDTTAPTVPSSVVATANSSSQITVTWNASTDAVGVSSYRLRRGGVDVSGATALTGLSFVDTGLTASTLYSYTVSAVDAAGNRSAESTAATATTQAVATATVSAIWQSKSSNNSLSVGWIISGATTFRGVISTNSALTSPTYTTSSTPPSGGWVNATFTGLSDYTTYYVGIEANGVLLSDGRGTYKTLSSTKRASKVIASSCNVTGSTHASFTRIKTEAPDFFCHMGDIHYADLWPTYNDATWRSSFASSISSSTFKPMLETVSMFYDPDNHDGPGTSLGYPNGTWDNAINSAVRQLTGEVYEVNTKGFYRTWAHAGVRYIELDRWSFRSDPAATESSSKTMLGTAQKTWFLNLLQNSAEQAIVVMAGFPNYSNLVSSGRWGSYNTERVEIGNAITALPTNQKNKIIFIGGDSHSICADTGANAMWGRPSLNASPLNQSGGATSGTWNIANIDVSDTRGYFSRLTFTPSGNDLAFVWDAVQDDGTVMATWSTTFAAVGGAGTWTYWNGTTEVTLTFDGIWDGTTIVPGTYGLS